MSRGQQRAFRTGIDGGATIAGLDPGIHILRVSKAGFQEHSELVTIAPDQQSLVSVSLKVGGAAQSVSVVSVSPLAGLDRALDEIAAPVQAATAQEVEASGALDLTAFLQRRLNNVFLNEMQGNPIQPDVNYRGYTASPLLGTPQGVSVYLDGVRLNQAFGDVVSWDLIPRVAIAEVAVIPGSNPLFGLNTLGGALSARTKDGYGHAGTVLQLSGGSYGRKTAEFEHGGFSTAKGLNWYLASNFLFEDGWREASPSNVRQLFGKLGWQKGATAATLSVSYANNALIGNGIQERRFLERDYRSVYTKPDLTANRSPLANLTLRRSLSAQVSVTVNAYFRHIRTHTLNGDINEDSLDQSVYQPSAAERAALQAAGYTGVPASGATAANTPFPFWRCIGNVLLRDEPAEKCNGLLNRSRLQQRNYGMGGQVSWSRAGTRYRNQFTTGAAYDGNRIGFSQSSELAYLNPDRSITGVGAFGDGITGGSVDGEPYDTRVDLSGRIHSASLYVADAVSVGERWNVSFAGRFNRTVIDNRDLIRPAAGTGSLTGRHEFRRLNPAVGATYRVSGRVSLYAGVTEGSRAPTSIELGCADPNAPCRLPNAMAGDPPLNQVVTRTWEAGLRGRAGGEKSFHWNAGWFRADNRDDILFVASEQTGFGYFKGFDRTRRQGIELGANGRFGRLTVGGGYTYLDATFQSAEEVNGTGNSSNEQALRGRRGLEGTIEIEPGFRIPLMPRHMAKGYADVMLTRKLSAHLGVTGASGALARGNENNQHRPDGVYYLGDGFSPGYWVANTGARYQAHPRVQVFVEVNNLFNSRYYTGAQLGANGFSAAGGFVARPFPAIDGSFPVQQATFYAPGARRGAWTGLRIRF